LLCGYVLAVLFLSLFLWLMHVRHNLKPSFGTTSCACIDEGELWKMVHPIWFTGSVGDSQ
jgi:hypothetical protein